MKKQIISVLSILLAVFLSACGSISTHDYNAVLAERDELLIQKENLEKEYTAVCEERDTLLANARESTKLVTATISGHFTAHVRSTLPDYCFDDTTPMMAVVTCFQSPPFTLFLGDELTSQIEVGEAYVFEIEEENIELTQQQYDRYPPSPEVAVPLYGLRISSIRPAEEDDLGLNSYAFEYGLAN